MRRDETSKFRPEIEGLRAVACLLVAIFHVWLGRVSGGVDVFFTIAGFLITTTLLGHVDKHGHVRPLQFLARLARRLLPATSVVLVASFALILIVLAPVERRSSLEQVAASALYFENWYLAWNSVDYLATDESRSPLQHFWAMSVQGQFYLIWLVLFIAVVTIARLLKFSPRRALGVVFAVVLVSSLFYSVVATANNQAFAYFNTFARVWEFAIGGIVALAVTVVVLPRGVRIILGWLGLAGIMLTGFVIPVSTVFPGYAALVPTASAALVILAGTTGSRVGVDAILGSRPAVKLGGMAYGIYLWHWPLLIGALAIQGRNEAGPLTGAVVILTAIGLAYATNALIERPLQMRSLKRPESISAVTSAVVVAVLCIAGGAWGGITQIDRNAENERLLVAQLLSSGVDCFGAAALDPATTPCTNSDLTGQYFPTANPRSDVPALYSEDCRTTPEGREVKKCTWGSEGAETKVALIGNSHAASWFPAYLRIAEHYGWQLDTYFKGACAFNRVPRITGNTEGEASCSDWSNELAKQLATQEPYKYILTSANGYLDTFRGADGRPDPEAGYAGYREILQPIMDRGSVILAIRDYPQSTKEVIQCGLDDPASSECFTRLDDALTPEDRDVFVRAARSLGIDVIDMHSWLCEEDRCPAVVGNVHIYRDPGHLTRTYVETLTPYLLLKLHETEGFNEYG